MKGDTFLYRTYCHEVAQCNQELFLNIIQATPKPHTLAEERDLR